MNLEKNNALAHFALYTLVLGLCTYRLLINVLNLHVCLGNT